MQVLKGLTDEELGNLDAVEGNGSERVTVGVVREVSLKILISKRQHLDETDCISFSSQQK